MAELQEIDVTVQDNFILATLQCKRFDEEHADNMQERIKEAFAQSPDLPLVLEMSTVEFVPSTSIGALLAILQITKKKQSRFILAGPQPEFRRTLAICRLDKFFEMSGSVDEASAKLAK